MKPVFILFFLSFSVSAQENLVPNGDFENYMHCPSGIGNFVCSNWFSPTTTTPDYYSLCNNSNCSVPDNAYGTQNPFSGKSYTGINLNADDGYREYIAVKFNEPLKPMTTYVLTFNISASDLTDYASNNFGAFFLKDTANLYTELMLAGTPAIISNSDVVFDSAIISDTSHWVELSFEYIAKGCEQFLILGNFLPQSATSFGENLGFGIDSYYYIDDVVLQASLEMEAIPNIFTPNNDGLNDYFEVKGITYTSLVILNRWGNVVFEDNGIGKWNGDNQSAGVYFYVIDTGCVYKRTGFVELMR